MFLEFLLQCSALDLAYSTLVQDMHQPQTMQVERREATHQVSHPSSVHLLRGLERDQTAHKTATRLLLQALHIVQQKGSAAAHMSAGSRSTTCKRWMVNTPCRRRSVLLPRQCLQIMRPLPRHTSHSLVKISPISRKNWPYTMANDATCAYGRSLSDAAAEHSMQPGAATGNSGAQCQPGDLRAARPL